jgi:tRNA/rRNA methyltransferase
VVHYCLSRKHSEVPALKKNLLQNIDIVLVGTLYSGNLGSVARAMHNMGLDRLRLVQPRCAVDDEAIRMARGGRFILERARRFRTTRSALRGISLVIGTTAKTGGNRAHAVPIRTIAPLLVGQAATQRVGIVFGPEDTGLVDDDLMFSHRVVRIPTHSRFRSLNLAQAVMVVCYELYVATLEGRPTRPLNLAPAASVEAMYVQLEEALRRIGFLHAKNARHMMFALRRLFGRAGLEPGDVAVLRGIARQVAWYASRPGGRSSSSTRSYECTDDTGWK